MKLDINSLKYYLKENPHDLLFMYNDEESLVRQDNIDEFEVHIDNINTVIAGIDNLFEYKIENKTILDILSNADITLG
ncbi:hypothetical protein [Ignavigranum ruoffiae]|uniref:hypothetical protein n=1 Tax=Ignavigranum ruoffiae TaxID=89093 RepID=UPI0024AE21C9|nr:hypothetical protein [Ignavigranum ruoffiae]